MRCREGDDPFTQLGQDLFAKHGFTQMITGDVTSLRLDKTADIPLDVIVVDSVDKVPTEN